MNDGKWPHVPVRMPFHSLIIFGTLNQQILSPVGDHVLVDNSVRLIVRQNKNQNTKSISVTCTSIIRKSKSTYMYPFQSLYTHAIANRKKQRKKKQKKKKLSLAHDPFRRYRTREKEQKKNLKPNKMKTIKIQR